MSYRTENYFNYGTKDAWEIYGEVQNVSNKNIENVIVKATLYENRGYIAGLGATDSRNVYIPLLVPGQKSPFSLLLGGSGAVRYELEIVSFQETVLEPYREFKILSQGELMAYDGSNFYTPPPQKGDVWTVQGVEVVNIGARTAENVSVSVTFYGATGNVIGVGGGYVFNLYNGIPQLAPNVLHKWSLIWGCPGNSMPYPASYIIQVYEEQ